MRRGASAVGSARRASFWKTLRAAALPGPSAELDLADAELARSTKAKSRGLFEYGTRHVALVAPAVGDCAWWKAQWRGVVLAGFSWSLAEQYLNKTLGRSGGCLVCPLHPRLGRRKGL
ncbi:hypothetical protein [Pyrobaculum sp.]|uniref:hypothetical protein n=1 Tax=Pyrobaculum sp. TaxID=2004705 RepID=UPI00316704EE